MNLKKLKRKSAPAHTYKLHSLCAVQYTRTVLAIRTQIRANQSDFL